MTVGKKRWQIYENVLRRACLDMRAPAHILFGHVLRLIPEDAPKTAQHNLEDRGKPTAKSFTRHVLKFA